MNERGRIYGLKRHALLHMCSCRYSRICVKRIVNACLAMHQISKQSVWRLPNMKKWWARAHVQCAPLVITIKRSAVGPITTTNFSTIRPAVPEIRKRCAHVRTCSCTPSSTFVKRLANGYLNTYQISTQSVQPFPRPGKGALLHVCTCRCTTPMTRAICTATWSLDTHQIWSQSTESFLSYS